MTNDEPKPEASKELLQRLREDYGNDWKEFSSGEVMMNYEQERHEAADEIERLRHRYDLAIAAHNNIIGRLEEYAAVKDGQSLNERIDELLALETETGVAVTITSAADEPCVEHEWRDEKEFVSCRRCSTVMAKRDLPPAPGPFTHYRQGYKDAAEGFRGDPEDVDVTARQMARRYVKSVPAPTPPPAIPATITSEPACGGAAVNIVRAGVWQPIETAPRDGRRILLASNVHSPTGPRLETGFYSVDPYVSENGQIVGAAEGFQGDGDDCIPSNQKCFTHWAPIPALTKSESL
jgi:hypothetical protein